MSYSVVFTGEFEGERYRDGPSWLCPVAAWGDFARWCATLDPVGYRYAREFGGSGAVTGTGMLADDLTDALERFDPGPDVRGTAEALLALIGVGSEGETARLIVE